MIGILIPMQLDSGSMLVVENVSVNREIVIVVIIIVANVVGRLQAVVLLLITQDPGERNFRSEEAGPLSHADRRAVGPRRD